MGLNMDINEIYFSNLKKFDGKKTRRLNLIEMSQIAGRAGRYKNDGGFGTTGDCETLNSDEIEKIEKIFEEEDYQAIFNIYSGTRTKLKKPKKNFIQKSYLEKTTTDTKFIKCSTFSSAHILFT